MLRNARERVERRRDRVRRRRRRQALGSRTARRRGSARDGIDGALRSKSSSSPARGVQVEQLAVAGGDGAQYAHDRRRSRGSRRASARRSNVPRLVDRRATAEASRLEAGGVRLGDYQHMQSRALLVVGASTCRARSLRHIARAASRTQALLKIAAAHRRPIAIRMVGRCRVQDHAANDIARDYRSSVPKARATHTQTECRRLVPC